MSTFPNIQRAIPKRRYHLGDYGVTLLGEVESGDSREFLYIMAFVREGEPKPVLFVCSEPCPPGEREQGSHRLRVITSAMSEVMESGDRWRDLEAFAEEGLRLGGQALGLTQEIPFRLS